MIEQFSKYFFGPDIWEVGPVFMIIIFVAVFTLGIIWFIEKASK